jgi:hypothetical protein
MFRSHLLAVPVLTLASILAQPHAASFAAPPSPGGPPTPGKTAVPAPSATPTVRQMIDSLSPADINAAMTLLKSDYTNPNAITETEVNRAMLEGLLIRQSRGLMLLPASANTPPAKPGLYAEIFQTHTGYLRLGALDKANLKAMDKKLSEFASSKIDGLIVDLRDSPGRADFDVVADFAKRFCPKDKTLFTLHNAASHTDRRFISDRDPAYQGLIVVLTDGDTAGGAEVLAALLRLYDKALIVGEPTAGRAVEYSNLSLPSGKILRVAVAEAVLPDGHALFPTGLKPDLPVEMSLAEKQRIFKLSSENGMGPFVYEPERPHLNEAALLAGTNPDIDAAETQGHTSRRVAHPMRDLVLQRALDLITSLEVYQQR